jgi:hypothetical protein
MPIIATLHHTIAFWRDNSYRADGLNAVNQGVGIVALVSQHRIGFQTIQKRFGLRDIRHFSAGQQPTHRITQRIDYRMNFARQTATRTADRLMAFFFWAPAECWWARTTVLSIISASKSRSPLTASTTCCHTPDSPQRLNRVYVVCQLPNSAGKSRQGEPVRTIHKTASKNRRLSCAVAPRSPAFPGNNGSNFSHWSSRSSFLISCIFGTRILQIPDVNTFF